MRKESTCIGYVYNEGGINGEDFVLEFRKMNKLKTRWSFKSLKFSEKHPRLLAPWAKQVIRRGGEIDFPATVDLQHSVSSSGIDLGYDEREHIRGFTREEICKVLSEVNPWKPTGY